MKLVFATNNKNKVYEVSKLIDTKIQLLSLADIDCTEELPETQATIEGNALQKAKYVFDKFGCSCFADDTGLEIEALKGRPGVLSARYAGEGKSADDNMNKVLAEMKGLQNRKAKFRTIIALILDGKQHLFEGCVEGIILDKKQGEKGFGYDPIFAPINNSKDFLSLSFGEGESALADRVRSFAQISIEEKNKVSHRAIAVKKLVEYLNSI